MKITEERQFDYIPDKIFKNLSKRDRDNLRSTEELTDGIRIMMIKSNHQKKKFPEGKKRKNSM